MVNEMEEATSVVKTVITDDSGYGSTTRVCMLIGYITFSLISIADCLYKKGISSNSIIVCSIMLGGGALQYGTNVYKNLKNKDSVNG